MACGIMRANLSIFNDFQRHIQKKGVSMCLLSCNVKFKNIIGRLAASINDVYTFDPTSFPGSLSLGNEVAFD